MSEPIERPAVRVPAARCPYCHEEVRRGEEPAVCAECHALHHVGCLTEHGACAACGTTRSGQAPREQRARVTRFASDLPPGPSIDTERRAALRARATLVMLVLTALGAAIGASTGNSDSGIGWAVLAAAMTGVVGAALRGARHGWGIALCAVSPGLLVFLATSAHGRERHTGELFLWGAGCLVVGVALLRSGSAERPVEK